MDKIIEVSAADGDAIVQTGVKWEDLNNHLAEKGVPLFFPLDPGPGATIGGMAGTGCSGTNAVRYGTAKAEWFLNLVREGVTFFVTTSHCFLSLPTKRFLCVWPKMAVRPTTNTRPSSCPREKLSRLDVEPVNPLPDGMLPNSSLVPREHWV